VSRGIAAIVAVWLLGAGSALAGPEPAPAAPADPDRYEEIRRSFDDALREASERARDEVALLEAEEIATIADVLLAEGETEIAVTLLEEALGLLAGNAVP
jgi:hypothetical protein